jgi:hypothetical protein
VHFHFTPTHASWLSQVECWFSILGGQSLQGASFTSVAQLRKHIDAFVAHYNQTARPFAWTKSTIACGGDLLDSTLPSAMRGGLPVKRDVAKTPETVR